jgi:endonuclease/exonuclease/phosphatase family metal-dependent hydrolase
MDGKLSALRITRVIEQFNPDIVALQELDVGRKRTGHENQAKAIADILKMDHFFFPAIAMEQEQYGDAILSRFPIRLVKSGILPGHTNRQGHEPRGALWVEVDLGVITINIINTHLGLTTHERQQQIEALLGNEWAGHDVFERGGILCGDFNFRPQSKLYRKCRQMFETAVPHSKPVGTYCGHRPLIRLDHIFYKNISLETCRVGNTALARIASDHRPLIAKFKL